MTISEASDKLETAIEWMSEKVKNENTEEGKNISSKKLKYSDCQLQLVAIKNEFDIQSVCISSGYVTPKVQKLLEKKDFSSKMSDYDPNNLWQWIREMIGAFYFMYHPEKGKNCKRKKGLFVGVIIITVLLSIAALLGTFMSDLVPEDVKPVLGIFSIDGFAGAILQTLLGLREWWSDENEIISDYYSSIEKFSKDKECIEKYRQYVEEDNILRYVRHDNSVNRNLMPMLFLIFLTLLSLVLYVPAIIAFLR